MHASHCRAARGLLDWTQTRLARESGVSISTIRGFEGDQSTPIRANLAILRATFETAGVEFTDPNGGGPGVRLRE